MQSSMHHGLVDISQIDVRRDMIILFLFFSNRLICENSIDFVAADGFFHFFFNLIFLLLKTKL